MTRKKWSWFTIVNYAVLSLLIVICLVPILHVIATSLSERIEAVAGNVGIWPKGFNLAAYQYVMEDAQFWKSLSVTLMRVAIGVPINIILVILTAYPLSKSNNRFHGRTFFSWFFVFTMLFNGGMVSSYIVNSNVFGMRNTFWVLLLPSLCGAYNIIVLRTFFSSAGTESLIEAAKIDGASEFRIYGQIILPISKPALATIGLFTAIAYFSKWFEVLMYIDDRELWTIQYMLQRVMKDIQYLRDNPDIAMSEEGIAMLANLPNESAKMALTVITMTPVLAFYPFFQKYFVKGLTLGAIKG